MPFLKKLIGIIDLQTLVGKDFSYLNRLCGDEGNNLSGGQKQRIALARELYRKPKILFMDESLSAIEKKNQEIILTKIRALDFIKSIIYITHDRIDWMEDINLIDITI